MRILNQHRFQPIVPHQQKYFFSNCFKYFVQSSSKRAEVRFLHCNHFIPSTERYFFLRFRQKVYVVVIHYRMPLLHGLVDISHHQFVLLSEKRGVKQAPRALVNFSAGSSISNCWEISKEERTSGHVTYSYCIVANTSPSHIKAHASFFKLSMKWKLDVYLLWHFWGEKS